MEPLTADEAQFAADHHNLVFRFLSANRLPPDFYDIIILGYIRSVKKWFARGDLQAKYKFTTIAWDCLRTSAGNYRRSCKHRQRHETFSLDALIPGTESMAFADTIQDPSASVEDRVCIRETISEAFRFGGAALGA